MQNNYHKKSLALSIIFFVFFCFVFLFIYKKVDSNNKISEQVSMEWQAEASRRNDIKSLNKSIKVIEKERASLETHFAQSSDIVPFLNTIEKLASQVKVKMEVVSVDILKDNTGLMVEIKISGIFESIYKLLTLLENSPYELEFISADVQKSVVQNMDNRKKSARWDAVLKIKLLSFIQ